MIMEGSHCPQMEKKDQVNALIHQFLENGGEAKLKMKEKLRKKASSAKNRRMVEV